MAPGTWRQEAKEAGGGCARSLVPRWDGRPQVSRPLMDELPVYL